MWDEDFSKDKGVKKFELGGRVIERDELSFMMAQKMQLEEAQKAVKMNRIVKTTNVDVFLGCDFMTAEELEEAHRMEVVKDDEEEDPVWDEIEDPESSKKSKKVTEETRKNLAWQEQDDAIICVKKTSVKAEVLATGGSKL